MIIFLGYLVHLGDMLLWSVVRSVRRASSEVFIVRHPRCSSCVIRGVRRASSVVFVERHLWCPLCVIRGVRRASSEVFVERRNSYIPPYLILFISCLRSFQWFGIFNFPKLVNASKQTVKIEIYYRFFIYLLIM